MIAFDMKLAIQPIRATPRKRNTAPVVKVNAMVRVTAVSWSPPDKPPTTLAETAATDRRLRRRGALTHRTWRTRSVRAALRRGRFGQGPLPPMSIPSTRGSTMQQRLRLRSDRRDRAVPQLYFGSHAPIGNQRCSVLARLGPPLSRGLAVVGPLLHSPLVQCSSAASRDATDCLHITSEPVVDVAELRHDSISG